MVAVCSGEEALQLLLERDFAVILLDVNMPGMSGLDTAAMIRQRKKSRHTPIIFVTAFADDVQTVRGYALGAVDYILTPIVPGDPARQGQGVRRVCSRCARSWPDRTPCSSSGSPTAPWSWSSRRAAARRGARAQAGRGTAHHPGAGAGASCQEPALRVPVDHHAHADRRPLLGGGTRDPDGSPAVARPCPRPAHRRLLEGRGSDAMS